MEELASCPICGSPISGNYCTDACLARQRGRPGRFRRRRAAADSQQRLRDEADELDLIARAEAEFTLDEHLTWNLYALLPTALHRVADYVIGALDGSGFLTESDEAIAAATGATLEEVEQVLAAMRGLEPIGIGSRSITESLLAQIAYLREMDDEVSVPPIAEVVVRDHLQQLGERKFREIGQRIGVESQSVVETWEFVKSNLHPYPTSAFTAAVTGVASGRSSGRTCSSGSSTVSSSSRSSSRGASACV